MDRLATASLFMRFAAKYLRRDAGIVLLFILLSVLLAITESFGVFLLVPLLESAGATNVFTYVPLMNSVAAFFDGIEPERRLLVAAGIMFAVVIVRGAISFLVELLGYGIPVRIDLGLRSMAFRAMMAAESQFRDKMGAGQVSNFTVAHPARIGILMRFVAMLIANLAILVCFVLVITIVAPVLSWLAFIYAGLATLLFKLVTGPLIANSGPMMTAANERFSQLMYETLNGQRQIRVAGATRSVTNRMGAATAALERARFITVGLENMTAPFFGTIGGLLICLVVLWVSFQPPDPSGGVIGLVVIFFTLMFRILAPLSLINISWVNIGFHMDAVKEFSQLFNWAEESEYRDGHAPFAGLQRDIRLENVSFSYAGAERAAVDGVDLSIEKGTVVGVVGASGSGKSTLASIITRLHHPTSGRVLVDGKDLAETAADTWWPRLGVVNQDTMLLRDTVRANIAFGLDSLIDDEQIRQAAAKASIDGWIRSLPAGYDTELSDLGANISAGQKQRLSLARAFARNPEIYVLDEATSGLDPVTQRDILDGIYANRNNSTVILVTHDVASLEPADKIVVMDAGKVAAVGTYAELLAENPLFQRMVEASNAAAA